MDNRQDALLRAAKTFSSLIPMYRIPTDHEMVQAMKGALVALEERGEKTVKEWDGCPIGFKDCKRNCGSWFCVD